MRKKTMISDSDVAKLTMPVSKRDHIQGEDSAQATLVEYGDYECPYCGQAYPIVKEVQNRLCLSTCSRSSRGGCSTEQVLGDA
jgi:hypothetical protein